MVNLISPYNKELEQFREEMKQLDIEHKRLKKHLLGKDDSQSAVDMMEDSFNFFGDLL